MRRGWPTKLFASLQEQQPTSTPTSSTTASWATTAALSCRVRPRRPERQKAALQSLTPSAPLPEAEYEKFRSAAVAERSTNRLYVTWRNSSGLDCKARTLLRPACATSRQAQRGLEGLTRPPRSRWDRRRSASAAIGTVSTRRTASLVRAVALPDSRLTCASLLVTAAPDGLAAGAGRTRHNPPRSLPPAGAQKHPKDVRCREPGCRCGLFDYLPAHGTWARPVRPHTLPRLLREPQPGRRDPGKTPLRRR